MERVRMLGNRERTRRSIDIGGGLHITPEDVLESHFRRLALQGNPQLSQEVSIQVRPNLHSAIRVVAPTLAPLTQIAEELATRIPTMQPSADFRSELHRELELAHRRQTEQRSHQAAAPRRATGPWLLAAAIAAAGLAGVALWLLGRKRVR